MNCELKPCLTLPKPTVLTQPLKPYPTVGSNPISNQTPLITSCDGCNVVQQFISTNQDLPNRVIVMSLEPNCNIT